jgi:hypothetical protein
MTHPTSFALVGQLQLIQGLWMLCRNPNIQDGQSAVSCCGAADGAPGGQVQDHSTALSLAASSAIDAGTDHFKGIAFAP